MQLSNTRTVNASFIEGGSRKMIAARHISERLRWQAKAGRSFAFGGSSRRGMQRCRLIL
jgi:hypothetical protein